MQTPYFSPEHDLFRRSVRDFFEQEVRPHAAEWEREQRIPREIWKKMGELGFLGINFPEKYGGAGADFFYSVAFLEEVGRVGLGGFAAAVAVQEYMATAHLFRAGSEKLKQRYLAPSIAGEKIGALAITEPNTGSDVGAIRTTAVRDGKHYRLNGAKTFITNGFYGDFITVAVKTDPEAGTAGISLIVVDGDARGLRRTKLEKMGWHCSDTAELAFDDVKVPATNLIGRENMGFYYIMESFQLERLVAALQAIGGCEACLALTLQYISERQAFNRPLAKFQTIRHEIADLSTDLEAARHLAYHASWLQDRGDVAVKECSMAKLLTSELGKKIVDSCLQLFGGYGFMAEYEISRFYRDARAGTIVGGTSEIMREIISRIIIDGTSYDSAYEEEGSTSGAAAPLSEPASTTAETAIPQTAAEILQSLPARFRPDKAGSARSCFHFDLAGDGGGQFTVLVGDGGCRVEAGLHGTPDCTVKAKARTYRDIEHGVLNPQTAYLMGRIKVSNLSEMLRFAKLFKPLTET